MRAPRRAIRMAVVTGLVAVAGGVSCRPSRRADPPATSSGNSAARNDRPTVDKPSAQKLEAYLTGAGSVHLGMTESEVSDAFDARPTRRGDTRASEAPIDVVWDNIGGPRPGGAYGLFIEGRLERIEFVPRRPDMPRISRAAANALKTGEVARRSYERTLTMADIEAVTGPGYRATWFIDGRRGTTHVGSQWMWEIEPGGKALVVRVVGDDVGQPVERPLPPR